MKKYIYILVLGEELTQGLDDTTIIAKANYSIKFTRSRKKSYFNRNYDRSNSFLYVKGEYIYIYIYIYSTSKAIA